jgi:hypothetical protein
LKTISQSIRATVTAALLFFVPAAMADDHVVPLTELHNKVQSAAKERDQNLEKLSAFFKTEAASKAFKTVHMSGEQVQRAMGLLTDDEVADLSARASRADSDFTAGALSNQELTYVIIALATAVVILVIVAA